MQNELTLLGTVIRWTRGQRLWDQGAPARGLLVVCSGGVELQRNHPSGVLSVDLVVRGELAGEESLIAGSLYGLSAVGVGYGSGTWIPEARLYGAMLDTPDLGARVYGEHLKRFERVAHAYADLEFAPVEARVARLMLRLCDAIGLPDARGTFIPVRLYKVQIARLSACRSETVIRLLKRWDADGVLHSQREGFVVPDMAVLETLALPEEMCSFAM